MDKYVSRLDEIRQHPGRDRGRGRPGRRARDREHEPGARDGRGDGARALAAPSSSSPCPDARGVLGYPRRMPTAEEVVEALRQVEDPELGMDIVELGLLGDVEVDGAKVKVTYTLTSMACPVGPMIQEDIDRVDPAGSGRRGGRGGADVRSAVDSRPYVRGCEVHSRRWLGRPVRRSVTSRARCGRCCRRRLGPRRCCAVAGASGARFVQQGPKLTASDAVKSETARHVRRPVRLQRRALGRTARRRSSAAQRQRRPRRGVDLHARGLDLEAGRQEAASDRRRRRGAVRAERRDLRRRAHRARRRHEVLGRARRGLGLRPVGLGLEAADQVPQLARRRRQLSHAFGVSVALSGDGNVALVGASLYNDRIGAAFLFRRNGSGWTQLGKILSGAGAVEHTRGSASSVALSADGKTATVGGAVRRGRGEALRRGVDVQRSRRSGWTPSAGRSSRSAAVHGRLVRAEPRPLGERRHAARRLQQGSLALHPLRHGAGSRPRS